MAASGGTAWTARAAVLAACAGGALAIFTSGGSSPAVLAFGATLLAVPLAVVGWQVRRGAPLTHPAYDAWRAALPALTGLAAYLVAGVLLTGELLDPWLWLPFLAIWLAPSLAFWRPRRRLERQLRAERPDAAVVSGVLADDGSLHLARWARAARVTLPALAVLPLLLVAGRDGLELWSTRGSSPRLALVPWDDVVLARTPVGDGTGGSWAVVTLRGPAPSALARAVPQRRTPHPVAVMLYEGSRPALSPEAVDRLVASLEAQRPSRPLDAAGDVG